MTLPEQIKTFEDHWYLDEFFCEEIDTMNTIPKEKPVLRSFIDQEEMHSPVFITPPERLYLPNIPGHLQLNLKYGFYQIDFDPNKTPLSSLDRNEDYPDDLEL